MIVQFTAINPETEDPRILLDPHANLPRQDADRDNPHANLPRQEALVVGGPRPTCSLPSRQLTNRRLPIRQLTPNRALRNAIQQRLDASGRLGARGGGARRAVEEAPTEDSRTTRTV